MNLNGSERGFWIAPNPAQLPAKREATRIANQKVKKTFATEDIFPLRYSIQKVNRKLGHGVGIWGNPRVPASYRVDEGLKKRFNEVAKAKFGSTCRAIESLMVAVVACSEAEVNLSTTVNIKEIRIERNVRARRALVVDKPNECGYAGCKSEAVATGIWKDKKEFSLCARHLAEAKKNPREWKVVPGEAFTDSAEEGE